MKTEVIKVLLIHGTSLREYKQMLIEQKIEVEGGRYMKDPELCREVIQKAREDEAAINMEDDLMELFKSWK
jgi:hypothetical protein